MEIDKREIVPKHIVSLFSCSPLSFVTLSQLSFFLVQSFKQLARTYADAHTSMADNNTERCGASFYRTGGITNGAMWYSFAGGELPHTTRAQL